MQISDLILSLDRGVCVKEQLDLYLRWRKVGLTDQVHCRWEVEELKLALFPSQASREVKKLKNKNQEALLFKLWDLGHVTYILKPQ